MYREFAPPAPLATFIECLWRRDLLDDGDGDRGVVLPDGRVDLVWIAGEPLVAGPQTRFVPRPPAPPGVAVGVRFLPSAGPPLLGLPAHELVDLHVPLADIDTARATTLRRRLAALLRPDEAGSIAGARAEPDGSVAGALAEWGAARPAIATALGRWLAAAEAPDRAVRAAVRLLDRPGAGVSAVARAVGYSERELRRRFRDSVGYGPKTLQRVLRFQRVLAGLTGRQEASDPLARLAASAGYSDQAHMTRETRELSGLTPAQLARSR
jgi:AraC-like DNA-binding protein